MLLLDTGFAGGSFYLSRVLSPLLLLSVLAAIGFGAIQMAFGDLESHFAVVVLYIVSFVLSTQSSSVGAVFMAVPVGLAVAVVCMGWMDRPNQEELIKQAQEKE